MRFQSHLACVSSGSPLHRRDGAAGPQSDKVVSPTAPNYTPDDMEDQTSVHIASHLYCRRSPSMMLSVDAVADWMTSFDGMRLPVAAGPCFNRRHFEQFLQPVFGRL